MSEIRTASSIILTRGPDHNPEIYLVLRSERLRFMGGFWAFPGGTLMQEDYGDANERDEERAFLNCGLRELFEETGILPGSLGENLSEADKSRVRDQLLNSESLDDWLEIVNACVFDDNEFIPVCQITTPPFSPLRYRTNFIHIRLPEGAEPVIKKGELVEGKFIQPAAAIKAWERGELRIAPPNLYLIRLLTEYQFPEFYREARLQTGRFDDTSLLPVYFTPGILMAPLKTPTLPPATTTNTLIVGHERLYVVEPATYDTDEQERLFEKMDELTAQGEKFEAILLTHHHPDHVGAVNAVSQRYQLPVRAHPLTYDRIPAGFIPGEPLEDGNRIALGTAPDGSPDWHLSVIATPGHAPDHLCYLESRYHAAFVGDMLSTVSTILIDPPEGHMHTYLRSLERLLEYPIKTLYPSHGPIHGDGHKLIRKFIEHRRRREEKLLEGLTAAPRSVDELLPEVYDDVTEATYPIAARSLLAGLIKLQEDGKCEQAGGGWKLVK